MKPTFFRTPAEFGLWLEKNHAEADQLLVGFYKKGSGKPSLTWPESVDEALCCGWIDGVRKRIDDVSYTIRFTPRKPRSTWSKVNVERVRALSAQGRMRPAGLAAFEARQVEVLPGPDAVVPQGCELVGGQRQAGGHPPDALGDPHRALGRGEDPAAVHALETGRRMKNRPASATARLASSAYTPSRAIDRDRQFLGSPPR